MQKKIIALAIAAAASTAAFAQTNVTIYGVADIGGKWSGDHAANGVGSRKGIDSGISAGSRLGFRGTEDLGNGLKASFVIEQGLWLDDGQVGNGYNRQAYAALSGGFGTAAFGRQYTPQHLFLAAVDPFGKGNVGNIGNTYINDARLDNLVAYVSPSFAGFTLIAGGTLSAGGDEVIDNNDGARVWATAVQYANGPIFAGFNVHQIRGNAVAAPGNVAAGNASTTIYDLVGSYDLGVAKLGAAYGQRRVDNNAANADVVHKQWMVGATVPFGKAKLMASYNRRTTEFSAIGQGDARVGQWAIGGEYALSARTALYAGYAQQNQNSVQEGITSGAAPVVGGFAADVGDAVNGGGGYQKSFALGLRHSF